MIFLSQRKKEEPEDRSPGPPASGLKLAPDQNAAAERLAKQKEKHLDQLPLAQLPPHPSTTDTPAFMGFLHPNVQLISPGNLPEPKPTQQRRNFRKYQLAVLKGRSKSVDPLPKGVTSSFIWIISFLGLREVLFQIPERILPEFNPQPSLHEPETKTQYLGTVPGSQVSNPILTLQGQVDLGEQLTDPGEHFLAFGHAPAQVHEVVGVPEPEQHSVHGIQRNVMGDV